MDTKQALQLSRYRQALQTIDTLVNEMNRKAENIERRFLASIQQLTAMLTLRKARV